MTDDMPIHSTLGEQIANRLRYDILTNKIEAGAHITTKQIATRYGVSDSPVREAFRTLAGENMLNITPHKGVTVLEVTKDFIAETCALVCAFQSVMLPAAMQIGYTDEDLAELEEINEQLHCNPEQGAKNTTQLNEQFHMCIFKKCKNMKTYRLFEQFFSVLYAYRSIQEADFDRIEAQVKEHQKIIDAIRINDVDAALAAIAFHENASKAHLLKAAKI